MNKYVEVSHVFDQNGVPTYTMKVQDKDTGETFSTFSSNNIKEVLDKIALEELPFCGSSIAISEWIKGGYPRELIYVPEIITGFVDNLCKAKECLTTTEILISPDEVILNGIKENGSIYYMPLYVTYFIKTGKHLKDEDFSDKPFASDYDGDTFVCRVIGGDKSIPATQQLEVLKFYQSNILHPAKEIYEHLLSLTSKGVYALDTRGHWVYAPGKTKEEAERIYLSLADSDASESSTSFFN